MNARWSPEERVAAETALAALPMYDMSELQAANDALWAYLAGRLRAAGAMTIPPILTRDRPLDHLWRDPRLLLSQTCGYPYVTALRGCVRLVATPSYEAHGCDGPFHRSVILVRRGERAESLSDMRGCRLALNEPTSNTGMNLLRAELAPLTGGQAFFRRVLTTGSHAASAAAVASELADLAAIDCITWAHIERLTPHVAGRLRVLAWTARSPGLPLITGRLTRAATFSALSEALEAATKDPALADVRKTLLISGFHRLSEPYYHSLIYLEQMASDQGYPELI